jgi:ATP-dependent RNA helicase DDX6/DHH1
MEDRHNLYRIEQELGTEIAPIPVDIDPKLYVAPSAIADRPASEYNQSSASSSSIQPQQQYQDNGYAGLGPQQPQQQRLPPAGNANAMRPPQQRQQRPPQPNGGQTRQNGQQQQQGRRPLA